MYPLINLLSVTEGNRDSLTVNVERTPGIAGDTAIVPIEVRNNYSQQLRSFEITLGGFLQSIKNVWIDTSNTLLAGNQWEMASNASSDSLKIAAASDDFISEGGTLLKLKMVLPDTVSQSIPINVGDVLFNKDLVPSDTDNAKIVFPEIGDVDYNGKIQAFDASVILDHIINMNSFSPIERKLADVTQNGMVTAMDASSILKYMVDIYDSLPVDTSKVAEVSIQNIAMKDRSGEIGDQIEIPITVGKASNLQSLNGVISYNRNMLDFVEFKKRKILGSFNFSYNERDGKIYFAAASNKNANIEDEEVLTLRFEIESSKKRASTTGVNMDSIQFNETGIMRNISNSFITVDAKEEGFSLPSEVTLRQNYPNPFNPNTIIKFNIPKSAHVVLSVFNTLGQKISTLVDRKMNAGYHSTHFKANQLPSGVYMYQLKVGAITKTRKMTVIK